MTPIRLLVGLGNPGAQYEQTRHNAGLWFLSELTAQKQDIVFRKKFEGKIAEITIDNHKCLLFFPTTYMNLSGKAVKLITTFYKIEPEEILIIHDDLDLAAGVIKLKKGGGHGGHNGLRNIVDQLHTKEFYRLRVGIGHPRGAMEVVNYVLNKPTSSEKTEIITAIQKAIKILPTIISGDMEKAMLELHTRIATDGI